MEVVLYIVFYFDKETPQYLIYLNIITCVFSRIEDDFDKLLQIKKCIKDELTSVPKTNPKPALLKKPETSISSGGQSLIVDQLKDQMDVLKYIQENESTAANDLELF